MPLFFASPSSFKLLNLTALTIAFLFYPSIQYEIALDGAETTLYGFPLPWNARSPAFSLWKDVYLIPLILDVALYGILSYFVLKAINKLPHRVKFVSLSAIWIWVIFCCLAFFINKLSFLPWFDLDSPRVTAIKIGFGF